MKTNTRLAVYKGTHLDLALPIEETDTTIGRDDGNALQLPDPQVSKRHAIIRAKGGVCTIEDLDSTNGTTVNGTRVKRTTLRIGDRIGIGPFEVVFESTSAEWVPSLVIDTGSTVARQTIVQRPQEPPARPGDRRV
jgi:pSer/pThr/pTyr-binding forkhead associated (FHA) protein